MKLVKIDMLYDFPQVFSDFDYEGKGVGGTEAYIILSSRQLARMGHQVRVYNSTQTSFVTPDRVLWQPLSSFAPREHRDILLIMRTMSELTRGCCAAKKAIVTLCRKNDGLKEWSDENADLIISVSAYQATLLIEKQNIDPCKIHVSSAGVDFSSYPKNDKKTPGKCIYCNVPYRGLDCLLDIWPEVKRQIPWATLYVTPSYLLWGIDQGENSKRCHRVYQRISAMQAWGVFNLECVSKDTLIKHQLESELMLYPSSYDEMCCIAALECAAAGCAIVTSNRAALSERVAHGKSGYLIEGTPDSSKYQQDFIDSAVQLLSNPEQRQTFGRVGRQMAQQYRYEIIVPRLLEKIMKTANRYQ